MPARCPRLAPHPAVAQGSALNASVHCPSSHPLRGEPAPSLQRLRSLARTSLVKPKCKHPPAISHFCAGNINLSTTDGTVAPPSREPVPSCTNMGLVLGRTTLPARPTATWPRVLFAGSHRHLRGWHRRGLAWARCWWPARSGRWPFVFPQAGVPQSV